ncbi:MAG: hypothetical protein O7B99_14965, partial [Planctomycetota bacterium]|nr:hypothetical protein [Planctomycetota bacterium]
AQSGGARRLLLAERAHLPVADASCEAVVCCRLRPHVADLGELGAIVRELVRVSSHLVVASFWDRGSFPALRRRLGRRDLGVRVAHSKDDVRRVFAAAGARVTGFEHSFRWLSQQTFAVAEKVR